jgi:hypothetical protein
VTAQAHQEALRAAGLVGGTSERARRAALQAAGLGGDERVLVGDDPATFPDAGLIVTTAEIQDYAHKVDTIVRAIDERVNAKSWPADKASMWAAWISFRLEWAKVFEPLKAPGWWGTWGQTWETVRKFHIEALQWRDKWAAAGVSFDGTKFPTPGAYTADVPSAGDLLGGAAWVAFGLGALFLLTRK